MPASRVNASLGAMYCKMMLNFNYVFQVHCHSDESQNLVTLNYTPLDSDFRRNDGRKLKRASKLAPFNTKES
jgi:hypothetical protein